MTGAGDHDSLRADHQDERAMRLGPGPQTMTPQECSQWLERLGLSATEGGELLNLSDPHRAMTRMLQAGPGNKPPSPPTTALMEAYEAIATALVCLRTGRPDDARHALDQIITGALKRTIRERAPGVEAIGRDSAA